MGAPALTSVLASNISAAWKAYLDQGQQGGGKGAASGELTASVGVLCQQGLGPLLTAHCVDRLERVFREEHLPRFWANFDDYADRHKRAQQADDPSALQSWAVSTLAPALAELHSALGLQKRQLADLLRVVADAPRAAGAARGDSWPKPRLAFPESERAVAQFQAGTSAWLLSTAPDYLPDLLRLYFAARLEEFSGGVKRAARRTWRRESTASLDSGGTSEDELGLEGADDEAESAGGAAGGSSSLRRRRSRRSSSVMDEDDGMGGPGVAPHVEGGDAMEGVERSPGEAAHNRAGLVNKHLAGVLGDTGGGASAWGGGAEGTMEGVGIGEMVRLMGVEWVAGVAAVARQLRELGLGALAEAAVAQAVHEHLQSKLLRAARGRYEAPVAAVFRRWIEAVPLRFLSLLLPPPVPPTPPSLYQSPAASPFPSPLACPATPAPATASGPPHTAAALGQWKQRLEMAAYEILGDLRTAELFDIIVDHPESLPAVEDLRTCLAATGRQRDLVDAFRAQLRQRLLLPGAATTDILTHYIATIKSLRVLDPGGVVLEAVGAPIQEYLRRRKDTIRGIVTLLTDDSAAAGGGESLYEELAKTAAMAEADEREDDDAGAADTEEEAAAAHAWEPDPIAAAPGGGGRRRRRADLISAVVGMYGSKEVLVNEYRVMLADRLLAKQDYNTATDVRTLELLKLRFADANLHQCDVMLKDLADSKRINTLIHTPAPRPTSPPAPDAGPHPGSPPQAPGAARRQPPAQGRGAGRGQPQPPLPLPPRAGPASPPVAPPGDAAAGRAGGSSSENEARLQAIRARMRALRSQGPPGAAPAEGEPTLDDVDATIVSAHFWPPFQADEVRLPAPVQSVLDAYSARYQELKAPRKLGWRTGLGTVRLEVERGGRAVQYAVSPIHAAIVWHFQDRPRWAARELAEAVGAPLGVLRKKAVFWVNQGVLAESTGPDGGGLYRLVEGGEGAARGPSEEGEVTVVAEEEGESAVTSAEEQMASEMQVYKDYVVGMLTNLDALPLERIHNMLKMFVVDPPFDKSAAQLQAFLNNLIRDDVLEFRDNMYRRARRPDAA